MPQTRTLHKRSQRIALLLTAALLPLAAAQQATPPNPLAPLTRSVDLLLSPFRERLADPVTLTLDVTYSEGAGKPIRGVAIFSRQADDAFSIDIRHPEFSAQITRSAETCFVHAPDMKTLLVSKGESKPLLPLTLSGVTNRLSSIAPRFGMYFALARSMSAGGTIIMLQVAGVKFAPPRPAPGEKDLIAFDILRDDTLVATIFIDAAASRVDRIEENIEGFHIVARPTIEWTATIPGPPAHPSAEADGEAGNKQAGSLHHKTRIVHVDRAELETALLKGVCRAIEIQADRYDPAPLADGVATGEHGQYTVLDGQRIVRLRGTPRQIGLQHGRFLKNETRKTVESTLYVVGLAYTFERGRWFPDDLRAATKRLDKFTPPEYIEEMRGLAEGSGFPVETIHITNHFPALFHCSGFAISGKATLGGKLYHGRILDYMTGVGLEDNAVVFAVEKEGKIPFVNIGYAGFVGSVTGMNARQVSIGEMGGGGEGDWDGVSMPWLMRMALENATTLEEARAVFEKNPRTCEYFYVLADGKDRSALGVAAWPGKIDFVRPGQSHELLPTPIEDCVLLSADERYKLLCKRTREQYGQFTPATAIRLMDAPVAMGHDNLHSALFVPEDLVFFVANAAANGGAYKQDYHRYSFDELFAPLPVPKKNQ